MELCDVNLSLVSNVWIKQLDFVKAGDWMLTHAHTFDHQTLLARGRLRVAVEGVGTKDFTAPQIIVVKAHTHHTLIALADETVAYCIHAIRDGERAEDIVDASQQVTLSAMTPFVDGLTNSALVNLG